LATGAGHDSLDCALCGPIESGAVQTYAGDEAARESFGAAAKSFVASAAWSASDQINDGAEDADGVAGFLRPGCWVSITGEARGRSGADGHA